MAENKIMALIPEQIELQKVPMRAVVVTALASLIAGYVGVLISTDPGGDQLWVPVLFALLPWGPLFFFEAAWRYEHYGFYALMTLFVILQLGHLGEHTVQVAQIWLHDGDFGKAHGVFGALDREVVHFVWDSLVWLGVLAMLIKLGSHNKWMWIAMVAASFHEVEHVFLYYLDLFERDFYDAGGTSGILARGGLIGTPLDRPYLHFVYNWFVVVPLCMAFWDETKRAYNLFLARALPSLTVAEKASATGMLERRHFRRGETIIRQGDVPENFYVVGAGEVDVVREGDAGEEHLATLGEGHFFGELGLLTGQPRSATVRARTDVDVFELESHEFLGLIARSKGAQADIDSEVAERIDDLKGRNIDLTDVLGKQNVPGQRRKASARKRKPTTKAGA